MNKTLSDAIVFGLSTSLCVFGVTVAAYTGFHVAQKMLGPIEVQRKD